MNGDNKVSGLSDKTEMSGTRNQNLRSFFWVIMFIIMLVVFSFLEHITLKKHTEYVQNLSSESTTVPGNKPERTNTLSWSDLLSEKLWSNVIEVLNHGVSFAVLIAVFGMLYMKHITKTIEEGFGGIGKTAAGEIKPITTAAVKALGKLAEAAEVHNKVLTELGGTIHPYNVRNDTIGTRGEKSRDTAVCQDYTHAEVEAAIENTKESVAKDLQNDEFYAAETKWGELLSKFPEEFMVVEQAFNFYAKYKKEAVLDFLFKIRNFYDKNPLFYRLLAVAYIELKETDGGEAKIKAIEAAEKCVALESENPRWYVLLGYVLDWFGEVEQAIRTTEIGHEKAEAQDSKLFIAISRGNLAFYYAENEDKEKEQIARDYAKYYLKFHQDNEDAENKAIGYDTLGYVQMKFGDNIEQLTEARNNLVEAITLSDNDDFLLHFKEVKEKIKNLPKA